MKNLSDLENKIGLTFKDKNLLMQALCHRSYLNENPDFGLSHNERLEFLGDAVLELAVTEYLYKKYPEKPEGDLTAWRASLVNTRTLSETARKMELSGFILLSKGEAREIGKARQSILANTFESLIGALYLDSGYEACYEFIKKNLIIELSQIIELGLHKDSKSRFQEIAQREKNITPSYNVLDEWGPDHKKAFKVGVFLGDRIIAEGRGFSKQEGEEAAAKKALKMMGWEDLDKNLNK